VAPQLFPQIFLGAATKICGKNVLGGLAILWFMSHFGDVGRGLVTPYISTGETRPANCERFPRVHVSTSPADHRRAAPHLLPRRAPVILKIGTRQPYRSATRGSAANGTTARSQPRSSRQLRATTNSDTWSANTCHALPGRCPQPRALGRRHWSRSQRLGPSSAAVTSPTRCFPKTGRPGCRMGSFSRGCGTPGRTGSPSRSPSRAGPRSGVASPR
jgi:hypothetical protein